MMVAARRRFGRRGAFGHGCACLVVGVNEIASFGFLLLLFLSQMIQLRFIKRDLDCIVPTQIVMLLENFANPKL